MISFILQASPYSKAMPHDSFTPLFPEYQVLFNQNWDKKVYLKGATVQLCAGAMLADDSQELLLNYVETYSHLPTLDAHVIKLK
jgi:hypothetical protein